jgi:hypothetical protein
MVTVSRRLALFRRILDVVQITEKANIQVPPDVHLAHQENVVYSTRTACYISRNIGLSQGTNDRSHGVPSDSRAMVTLISFRYHFRSSVCIFSCYRHLETEQARDEGTIS